MLQEDAVVAVVAVAVSSPLGQLPLESPRDQLVPVLYVRFVLSVLSVGAVWVGSVGLRAVGVQRMAFLMLELSAPSCYG